MFKVIRKLRAAKLFFRLVQDPNRLDDVFGLSKNADAKESLNRLADGFALFPQGAAALASRRRLPKYDVHELAKLPIGTLGHAFADHMISRRLDPAAIPILDGTDRGDFVKAHLYDAHDIWHVVTGFDNDVAGELGLQGFYAAQANGPLPSTLLAAGMLNAAYISTEDRDARMRNITAGWRQGKRAHPLFGIDWDHYWSTPLTEVRTMLGIDPEGIQPELAREAQIMNGLGGMTAYETWHAQEVAAKGARIQTAPMKQLQIANQ